MAKKLVEIAECSTSFTKWVATTEYGQTLEDTLKPEFWANVAKRLTPWDLVFVRDVAMEWCADLVVMDVGPGWALVKLRAHTVFDTAPVDVPQGRAADHVIKFAGPVRKYEVIRLSDKQSLKFGMSKTQAQAWLAEYLNTIAA
jgi:hypothetical protein